MSDVHLTRRTIDVTGRTYPPKRVIHREQVVARPRTDLVPPMPLRARQILEEEATRAGLEMATLLTPIRIKDVARARMRAAARMHLEAGYAMARIGRMMGNDHTTVINSVRRWKQGRLS